MPYRPLTYEIQEKRMKSKRGFTLIELLIVVAIITIIAAIAFPAYQQHIIRSNRSAAQSFIQGVANKQEQYILDSRVYANTLTLLNTTVPSEVSKNYAITITGVTATPPGYTIVATPTGFQLSKDTKCGTVSVNQLGAKSISGSGTVATCW